MNLNFRDIASKLSTKGWITVGAAALVGVLFIYMLMSMASSPSYTLLVGGQSPAQTQKITTALSTGGIAYQLTNNGTGVEVNPSDVGKARDLLDGQGLLSGSAGPLSSYMGSTSLGESQFQQQEQTTSAIEQQLDQTIEGMTGINLAQVQLAIPNQANNLFTGTNTQPTASVLLNTTSTLNPTAVKAIAGLVAGDVTGLNQSKITITDQNGDVLWPTANANSNLGSSLTAKQTAENAYDTQTADQVDAALAATLGPGVALVKINADLNANQQNLASIVYSKKETPASTATATETLKGAGAGTAGTAGNQSTNLASYAGANGSNSNYSNKTNTTVWNDGRTITHTTVAPGAINSQGISVIVNSKKVPPTELPTIRALVENAVGYNKKRGDTFSIGSLPFAKIAAPAATTSTTSGMMSKVKYVVLGVGALIFLFMMSRMLRRRESEQFAGQPTWLRELEHPRSLAEIEAQTQMVDIDGPTVVQRLRPPVNVARQQVEELVDRDPERVASQIRQWMTED